MVGELDTGSLLLPSCKELEFKTVSVDDSDRAWVNGKSAI